MRAPIDALCCLGLAAASSLARAAAASAPLTAEEHLTSQIEWIESRGGYYSSKIEYRTLVRDDPASPLGMFLSDDVDQGEVLMVIPAPCLLTTGTASTSTCDTVQRLAHEHELGEASDYHPYVRYVFDPRHSGDLPLEWSPEGRALLRSIAGEELFEDPTYDVGGLTYEGECGAKAAGASDVERQAFLHVLRRSWDDVMVPVYDMVNHRNPPYKNVDSNSPHAGEDVHVVALRDIRAGEQLYLSYNECTDCAYTDDYAYTYTAQYMLRDYGFVEQYPQRWTMFGGEMRFQIEERRPELVPGESTSDSKDDDGEEGFRGSGSPLKITWFNEKGPPDHNYFFEEDFMEYLYGHLKMLQDLPVKERTKDLRPQEAYFAKQFHSSLVVALQHVIWYAEDIDADAKVGGTASQPVTYGVGNLTAPDAWTRDQEPEYAVTLQQRTCSGTYLEGILHGWAESPELEISARYELLDSIHSFYQHLTFWESRQEDPDERDVCMKIERNWESCQSNRAHYHETLVHYPASFVPEVKRVMFLGGGDGMILHEVLKYESLEVVVGLELDKGVLMASFLHFQTLPHYDNAKVEWWFGDAAKSLRLLPREYLASFDLIYVDMQNYIVEALNIMEEASRYAHPKHGIVMRNEDGGFGSNVPYALHNIDLYDGDVPVFCHQPITMGSNVTDFMTAPRYAHDVSNLYYMPSEALDESTRFSRWYNYRKVDEFGGGGGVGPLESPSAGVFMVFDLEQVSPEKLSVDHIAQALTDAGVVLVETMTFRGSSQTNDITVFLTDEGYVLARTFPGERYCGLDVMLGSNYNKMYSVERSLALALDGGIQSSYRIVTGASSVKESSQNGMLETIGRTLAWWMNDKGDEESDKLASANDEDSCKDESAEAAAIDPAFALPIGQPHANAALRSIISALISPKASPEILVLCGDESQPCDALDVAKRVEFPTTLTSVHSCPASESIFGCESSFRAKVRDVMKRGHKIDAILIDASTPKQSAEVLHRIFDRSELRGQSLSDTVVVAGVSIDSASSAWSRRLLDRFRTEFFPYNPSFHARVLFRPTEIDTPEGDGEGSLGMSIYSAGNPKFYSELLGIMSEISDATGLSSDMRYVMDGMNNYAADFEPTQEFSRGSYDTTAALEQLSSQKPLGRQGVIQYEVAAQSSEYTPTSIASRLGEVLSLMGVDKGAHEIVTHSPGTGNGVVILALWDRGDASVIYDGATQLDVTLFTIDQGEEIHVKFEEQFAKTMPGLTHKLEDVQLRGTGRVVAVPKK